MVLQNERAERTAHEIETKFAKKKIAMCEKQKQRWDADPRPILLSDLFLKRSTCFLYLWGMTLRTLCSRRDIEGDLTKCFRNDIARCMFFIYPNIIEWCEDFR